MGAKTKALMAIERAEKQALMDATAARNSLIALTSFKDIDALARLAGTERQIEMQEALANLELCARRAAELAADRQSLAG